MCCACRSSRTFRLAAPAGAYRQVGTAMDYRIRYHFAVTPPREFVAFRGGVARDPSGGGAADIGSLNTLASHAFMLPRPRLPARHVRCLELVTDVRRMVYEARQLTNCPLPYFIPLRGTSSGAQVLDGQYD